VILRVLNKWMLIAGYSIYQHRLTEQGGDYPDPSNRDPHKDGNLAVDPPSLESALCHFSAKSMTG
jgi:hypothetical protein